MTAAEFAAVEVVDPETYDPARETVGQFTPTAAVLFAILAAAVLAVVVAVGA